MKDFDSWNKKKKEIHFRSNFNHGIKEREIWWCSIGENVGTEVFGKSKNFSRPVLIINAESSENVVCIPLSSKIKKGKYRAFIITEDNKKHDVLISQVRVVDKRRLIKKMYILDLIQYKKLKIYFDLLFKV